MVGLVRGAAVVIGVVSRSACCVRRSAPSCCRARRSCRSRERCSLGCGRSSTLLARDRRSYEARDRVMALYALPLGLMLLAGDLGARVILAFTLVFWGLGVDPLRAGVRHQRLVLHDPGFAPPRDVPTDIAAVGEAIIGLGLVALLISFLPSIYAAFQRRELMVSMLQVRAGSPPTAVQAHRPPPPHRAARRRRRSQASDAVQAVGGVVRRHRGEPHVAGRRCRSSGRRSPPPLVTASGAVLDGAALHLSVVDGAAGALRRAVPAGRVPRRSATSPTSSASSTTRPRARPTRSASPARSSTTPAAELAAAGVPLKPDLDQAWLDFRGWRVNYDTVLITLAGFFMAPYAPLVVRPLDPVPSPVQDRVGHVRCARAGRCRFRTARLGRRRPPTRSDPRNRGQRRSCSGTRSSRPSHW